MGEFEEVICSNEIGSLTMYCTQKCCNTVLI